MMKEMTADGKIATICNEKVIQVHDLERFRKKEEEIEKLDRKYFLAVMGLPMFFVGLCIGCVVMFFAFYIGTFLM